MERPGSSRDSAGKEHADSHGENAAAQALQGVFHLKTACCVPQKLRRTVFVIISRNFLPGAQSDLKSHQASFVLPRLSSGKDEESCEKINLYL